MFRKHVWLRLLPALVALTWLSVTARPNPVAAQSAAVAVTTDRAVYTIFDYIEVCWRVPGPGRVTLTDFRPDGFSPVALDLQNAASGCTEGAVVLPPAGRRCLRLDWSGAGGQSGSAETCIEALAGELPAVDAISGLVGRLSLDLCFLRTTATFFGRTLDASAAVFGGVTYAYVLVELSNYGPQSAAPLLAVVLFDDQFRGDRMREVPDEADYRARQRQAAALSPWDTIGRGQTERVLFVFPVPPGARVLALSPNPICNIG